jgi:phenylalanyl-tRNA synthetase alpha subunit
MHLSIRMCRVSARRSIPLVRLSRHSTSATALRSRLTTPHPQNNIPASIVARASAGLHLNPNHPLGQLKQKIQLYFERHGAFVTFDSLSPIVSRRQNFDSLLTPQNHISRQPTDTFYLDSDHLLRCHMTAHQSDLIAAGHSAFLMIGDVYRRDGGVSCGRPSQSVLSIASTKSPALLCRN